MTNEEIRKGNNLIAEFMNYTSHLSNGDKDFRPIIPPQYFPQYHYSWDWLMPVVAKCCEEISSRPGVDARGGWTPEYGYTEDIYTMRLNSSIEKVWKSVVSYIIKNQKKDEINN